MKSGGYREWLEGHAPVGRMECVGYKVPLFLGGEDSLEKMEVSDMEVYWDMTDQLCEERFVAEVGEGQAGTPMRFCCGTSAVGAGNETGHCRVISAVALA